MVHSVMEQVGGGYWGIKNGQFFCNYEFGKCESNIFYKIEWNIMKNNTKVEYIVNDGLYSIIINGISNISSYNGMELPLFGMYITNRTFANSCFMKLCKTSMFCNDNLVREFIPCYAIITVTDVDGKKRPAGTIGMYDTVEGKFYVNKGTGTFGYGTLDGTYVAPTNN